MMNRFKLLYKIKCGKLYILLYIQNKLFIYDFIYLIINYINRLK